MVLNTFTSVLSFSPSTAEAFNSLDHDYIREKFPFRLFLFHENPLFQEGALKALKTIIEMCPAHSKWQSYVHPFDNSAIEAYLGEIEPAKELPTFETLGANLAGKVRGGVLPISKKSSKELEDLVTKMDALSLDTPQDILDHYSQLQEELLNNDEKEVMASVAASAALLRDSQSKGNTKDIQFNQKLLHTSQQALVRVHHSRKEFKKKHMKRRIAYMEENKARFSEENYQNFKRNSKFQQDTLELLEKLYQEIAKATEFLNVSSELCFLDRQISTVIEVSFSAVVAGPINVGKSTVVNCITGQNLCPNRLSVMTAIPTNFVHDPQAEEPLMFVPFAAQLNKVGQKFCRLIEEIGFEQICSALESNELRRLAELLRDGLVFQNRYKGSEEIGNISVYIHDIFRLGVNPNFYDILGSDLPLDWSQGLDTYLTVYARFPNAEALVGLVHFSVIDTPGIDEYGVKKLNLGKTIEDALSVSTYGALICRQSDLNATGMIELKRLFEFIKERYHTPVTAILTHWDFPTESKEDCQLRASDSLSLNLQNRTFEKNDVQLVSGKKMMLARNMDKFIKREAQKPSLEQSAPAPERELAQDYAMFVGFGDLVEEKEEWYREASLEDIQKRNKRLIRSSFMEETISGLINKAINEGIPIIIRNCFKKVQEKIVEFLEHFKIDTNLVTIQQNLRKVERHRTQLKQMQKELMNELDNNLTNFQASLDENIKQLCNQVEQYLTSDIPSHPPAGVPRTIEDHIHSAIFYLQAFQLPKAFAGSEEVVMKLTDFQQIQTQLPLAFKKEISSFLFLEYRQLPSTVLGWSERKRKEIESSLKKIGKIYAEDFKINLRREVVHSIEPPSVEQQEETLKLNFHKKKDKMTRFFVFGGSSSKQVTLNPQQVRQEAIRFCTQTLVDMGEAIKREAEAAVREVNSTLNSTVSAEIHRVDSIAKGVTDVLISDEKKLRAPLRAIMETAENVLRRLQELVSQDN